MVYRNKFEYILIVLIGLFFLFGISSTKVIAKTDLEIKGNVLGYSLSTTKTFSSFVFPTNPLLVKVSKIIKGKEKSEYIIVRLRGESKDYIVDNFGVNKTLTFKLERYEGCDERIKDLMVFKDKDENGKIIETPQNFKFVSGINKELLSSRKIIPCYFVSQEG